MILFRLKQYNTLTKTGLIFENPVCKHWIVENGLYKNKVIFFLYMKYYIKKRFSPIHFFGNFFNFTEFIYNARLTFLDSCRFQPVLYTPGSGRHPATWYGWPCIKELKLDTQKSCRTKQKVNFSLFFRAVKFFSINTYFRRGSLVVSSHDTQAVTRRPLNFKSSWCRVAAKWSWRLWAYHALIVSLTTNFIPHCQ